MKRPTPVRLARRAPRGQAMVEYSLVTHFLLFGGGLGMIVFMGRLWDALTKFYDSMFFVLKTGAI